MKIGIQAKRSGSTTSSTFSRRRAQSVPAYAQQKESGPDLSTQAGNAAQFSLAHIPIFPPDTAKDEQAQELAAAKGEVQKEMMRKAASAGLQTHTSRLPYAEQLQRAFGRHEIGHIQAHLGPQATESAGAMQAEAYAAGNHVIFAGKPDLRTTAHEAAHVIQQRVGVQLPDGIGKEGDVYERHADAVAERVVAGQSAETMLDGLAGKKGEARGDNDSSPGSSHRSSQVTSTVANNVAIQRQKWKLNERGRGAGKKLVLIPYGPGKSDAAPMDYDPSIHPKGLNIGDVWDDDKGTVDTAKALGAKRLEQKKSNAELKKQENDEKRKYERGEKVEGRRQSSRLQDNNKQKFEEKKKAFSGGPSTGIYYTGGDSPGRPFDEGKGLRESVQESINELRDDQFDMLDTTGSNLVFQGLPPEVQERVLAMKKQADEEKEPQVHHYTNQDALGTTLPESEVRALYSSANLYNRTTGHNKQALVATPQSGIGSTLDDLSHSINRGQLPDELQNADEGGANHPLNIPYENYITNQVVNTSIEKVQQDLLDQGKKVQKVVARTRDPEEDRVTHSTHFIFTEDYDQPLVFGVRDLKDKKPKAHDHRH